MNNGDKASYRSGGVGAGSGVGKESGLSREISRHEAATPQPAAQARPHRQGGPGRREKSESPVVALIQSGESTLGSPGAALGPTRPKAAQDPVMAGRKTIFSIR